MNRISEKCELRKVACVIMASGTGSRFGSNKLLAEFDGQPLIARILQATDTPLFSRRIVVTRHSEIAQICRASGAAYLLHDLPGQNDTIRLGLEALICSAPSDASKNTAESGVCAYTFPSDSDGHFYEPAPDSFALADRMALSAAGIPDGCCFCTADQPLLSKGSVERLIRTFSAHPDRICRCAFEGRPGSPVLFPSEFFPALLRLPEHQGGGWIIRQHPGRVLPVPVDDETELADVDTTADLKRLTAYRTS